MSRSHNPEAYAEQAAHTPLFCGMPTDTVAALLRSEGVSVQNFGNGALIYSATGFSRCVGFLVSGSAKVIKGDDDGRMLMSVLHASDLFGAATVFSRSERYVADIRATAATWAVMITEDALRAIMQRDFRVAENYIAYLTARIRFLSARIDGFVRPTAEERVYLHLAMQAKDGAYRPEGGLRAIGDALCISRTTLYRAFDALERDGKIIKDGRTIRLIQKEEKQ